MATTDEPNPGPRETTQERSEALPADAARAVGTAMAPSRETSGLFRFSVTQFLAALIVMLVATSCLPEGSGADAIAGGLMTLVLVSAVLAVGGGRRSLALTVVLVLPAVAAEWLDRYQPGVVPQWLITGAGVVFIGFVIAQLLRFILRAPRVNSEVLCAGLSGYLLLGLLWASAYLLVARLTPGAFKLVYAVAGAGPMGRFDTLYLSFASLTCLGCNDIVPVSRPGRMLVVMEATVGALYLAVMIARLVALYSRPSQRERRRRGMG